MPTTTAAATYGFANTAVFKANCALRAAAAIPPNDFKPSFNDFTPSMVRFAPSANAIAPNAADSNCSACSSDANPKPTKHLLLIQLNHLID
jgi:hypothetical protein